MDDYEIERRIICFAVSERVILGVSRGRDPNEGTLTYYLLTGDYPHDMAFEDRVTDLDLRLADSTKRHFDISSWPTTPSDLSQRFLGDVIWYRQLT
ncbi:MAG: hypothetical protein Q8P57_01710 [Candidatus Pacearchaeota archaeon]|nr:hypothetical protein [Candidatus Pacearchaeota archaeon]